MDNIVFGFYVIFQHLWFLLLLFSDIVLLSLHTRCSFVFHLNINLISRFYWLLHITIIQTIFQISFNFEIILRRFLLLLIMRNIFRLLRVLNWKWRFSFLLIIILIRLNYIMMIFTLFWVLKWTFINQFNLLLVNILNILTNWITILTRYFQSLLFEIF